MFSRYLFDEMPFEMPEKEIYNETEKFDNLVTWYAKSALNGVNWSWANWIWLLEIVTAFGAVSLRA